LDLFKKNIPDVIAFTGGGLLRKELLRIPRQGILNCHSGILPSYRGMDVVEWAILERHIDHIGLSLHFMAAGVDTGPILMKKSVQPQAGETIATLRLRMEPLMVDLMLAGLRQLRDGRIKPTPQKTTDGRQYFVMHPRLKKQAQELFTATFSNKK
jgi:methionyl-tRNA formyltransferase